MAISDAMTRIVRKYGRLVFSFWRLIVKACSTNDKFPLSSVRRPYIPDTWNVSHKPDLQRDITD